VQCQKSKEDARRFSRKQASSLENRRARPVLRRGVVYALASAVVVDWNDSSSIATVTLRRSRLALLGWLSMSRQISGRAVVSAGMALALGASVLAFASLSPADEVTHVATTPQPVAMNSSSAAPDTPKVTYETRGPNLVMIGGGVITFGVSYTMAIVVTVVSNHQGDSHLLVPVVGPWLDFADRGSCGTAGVTRCDVEQGSKIGVAIDGIFQGVGVLTVVGGFVLRQKHETITTTGAPAPSVQVTPVSYAHGGMGLAAIGSF